jgi:hypothetical protein
MPTTPGHAERFLITVAPGRARAARLLAAVACLLAVSLSGCIAARPAPQPLPEARPTDFGLGVTVYAPPGEVRRAGQRPARYLVGPDGRLRAAVGSGAEVGVFPPSMRRLDEGERDRLWSMLASSGMDTVSGALRVSSPETFDPPSGRRVYLVEVTADGRRMAVAMPEGEPETEAFAAIADTLAEWAWVTP